MGYSIYLRTLEHLEHCSQSSANNQPHHVQAVPAPVPAGPSLNQAAVGLAGLAIAAKIAEDECDDVGVGRSIIGIITFTSVILLVTHDSRIIGGY